MAEEIAQALQPPDTGEYSGCFTGAVISSPHRCTATDSSPCHIIAQIPVCNELLYNVQLELQEYTPGQLCLVPFDYEEPQPHPQGQIDQAFRLVSCLLQNHRCIASLCIRRWNLFPELEAMISTSYRPSTALKSLRLLEPSWMLARNGALIQAVAPTLPFLTGLEELDCTLSVNSIEPLCCLLETSSALKKLTLTHQSMNLHEAAQFHFCLSKNSTLTDLSINWGCIMPEGANYSVVFGAFLEESTVLKTLSILCDGNYRLGQLKPLTDAIGRSTSLVNLTLKFFGIDNEDAIAIKDLIAGNCSLRSFIMKFCRWYPEPAEASHSDYSPDTTDVHSTRIRAWVNILQTNRSLEELQLNRSAFKPADWDIFFATLQNNNTGLKRVFVEGLNWYFHCRGILASCGSEQKTAAPSRPDAIITRCKQLCNIGFWLEVKQDVVWFEKAISTLRSCSHVTTLAVDVHRPELERDVQELIADYIKHTITLKTLRLSFPIIFGTNATQSASIVKTIAALKNNSSIRKLFLVYREFTDEEASLFTALMKSNKTIYDLEIFTSMASTETLVNRLSPGFAANYTLVSLRFHWRRLPLTRHFYYVNDVVRRNTDLVTRAAHCTAGNVSRTCAEAFELVAENPALLEKICELQSLGQKDAAQVVRNTRATLLGLDDFMRITDVVKTRVTCSSSEDYNLQLNDVDEYSWLQVRRLLRLSDVLTPA